MLTLRAISPEERDRCLSTAVYRSMQEAILAGTLPPGTVLSEVAVAEHLEVSRTPVHDALRQLAKDGLVEQNIGHRARVSKLNMEELFNTFEVRKLLEGHAAELAVGKINASQLVPLHEQTEALEKSFHAPEWLSNMVEYDDRFHALISHASGNRFLANDITRYRVLQSGFKMLDTNREVLRNGLRDHFRIIDALQANDGPAARKAMVEHIRGLQERFVRLVRRN